MTAYDWKPGDLLTDDDGSLFFVVDHVPVDRDHPLYTSPCVVDADGNGWRRGSLDESARRLVIVDPESDVDVARMENVLEAQGCRVGVGVQAALREFANPTLPEPTGLGAVVELTPRGIYQWSRAVRTLRFRKPWDWQDSSGNGGPADWDDLDRPVRVLSEGILS